MTAPLTLPLALTLTECCAVALSEAAAVLDSARCWEGFLAAIEGNHRLWLAMTVEEVRGVLVVPIEQRTIDFVMSMSYRAGRGISDRHVEALIGIDKRMSAALIASDDFPAIRQRVELVRKSTLGDGMALGTWLMAEIERRCRLWSKDPT